MHQIASCSYDDSRLVGVDDLINRPLTVEVFKVATAVYNGLRGAGPSLINAKQVVH